MLVDFSLLHLDAFGLDLLQQRFCHDLYHLIGACLFLVQVCLELTAYQIQKRVFRWLYLVRQQELELVRRREKLLGHRDQVCEDAYFTRFNYWFELVRHD